MHINELTHPTIFINKIIQQNDEYIFKKEITYLNGIVLNPTER